MRCPKCGNEQAGLTECAACGLVFEKYRRRLDQQTPVTQPPPVQNPPPSRGKGPLFVGVLVVIGLCAALLLLRGGREPVPVTASPVQGMPPDRPAAVAAPPPVSPPPGNPIEVARNATVLIKTEWGKGSGFFVAGDCSILTNRHVVKLGEAEVAEAMSKLTQWKEDARRIRTIVEANREAYRAYVAARAAGQVTDAAAKAIDEKIAVDERRLKEFEEKIRKAEEEFNTARSNSNIRVILADGSEYDGAINRVSEENDLALIVLFGQQACPKVAIGNPAALQHGDRLYTVGSPMGIGHSVTSGVFSGSVNVDGKPMLQTDAPINPGNSGGPLLDASGKVVGINTMKLQNAQGIGFAIPIDNALRVMDLPPE